MSEILSIENELQPQANGLEDLINIDPEYEARKLEYNTWLFEKYKNTLKSYVLFNEKYNKIIDFLRNGLTDDPNFKHWVIKSRYLIIKFEGKDVLGIEIENDKKEKMYYQLL